MKAWLKFRECVYFQFYNSFYFEKPSIVLSLEVWWLKYSYRIKVRRSWCEIETLKFKGATHNSMSLTCTQTIEIMDRSVSLTTMSNKSQRVWVSNNLTIPNLFSHCCWFVLTHHYQNQSIYYKHIGYISLLIYN